MATSSDVSSKLLAWSLAGGGVLLAYSAIRNRAPWDVLRDIQGAPLTATTAGAVPTTGAAGFSGGGGSGFSGSNARITAIANREMEPDLVAIRPSGKLDREAAASLERIHAKVGYVIPNTSGWRSFQEQANAYFGPNNTRLADGSLRFGHPDKSLHTVGLAIDVHSDYASRPEVVAAFASEGWQRPRPDAEPWHYSYLVRG